jgi:hypothetical protein
VSAIISGKRPTGPNPLHANGSPRPAENAGGKEPSHRVAPVNQTRTGGIRNLDVGSQQLGNRCDPACSNAAQ